MNNEGRLAAAAAAAGLAGLTLYSWHWFAGMSGANLAVALGMRADPHLPTAAGWSLILHACSTSQSCIQSWNTAAVGVLALLVAWIGWRSRGAFAGAASAAFLLTTPLCVALILDPLGAETTVALALFALVIADTAGLLTLHPLARALAGGALILQDPLFAPAVLAYALLRANPRKADTYALAGVAVIAPAARLLLPAPGLPTLPLDPQAAPSTFIALAMLFFVVLPALLYAAKRGLISAAALGKRNVVAPLLVGVCAAIAGVFSPTGDPAPYFLAAEIAAIFAVLSATKGRHVPDHPTGAVVAALAVLLQLAVGLRYGAAEPSAATARHSHVLRAALEARSRICLVSPAQERPHLLADGAFLRAYQQPGTDVFSATAIEACVKRTGRPTELFVLNDSAIIDYGRAGFSLAQAAYAARDAQPLDTAKGMVAPSRPVSLPGGHGVFASTVRTPLGDAPEIVAVAGFSETLPCPRSSPGSQLTFAAANPNPGGAPVRLSVSERTERGSELLLSRELSRSNPREEPAWEFYALRLHPQACRSLTFAATATTPDANAAWAAFVSPAVAAR